MSRSSRQFVFPDTAYTYSKRAHFLHLTVMAVAIVTISITAIFYSLGFQLNLQAHSIQQTGLIQLNSQFVQDPVTVTINSQVVSDTIHYDSAPVFPGTYSIRVTKSGYQPWSRIVDIEANKVASFRSIILLPTSIPSRLATSTEERYLAKYDTDTQGLSVKQNELWLDGEFITRNSEDITSAVWFPGRSHIIYQAGRNIWMTEPDGRQTQLLYTKPTTQLAPIAFDNRGKEILLNIAGTVYVLSL